jgi:ATP-dependent protease ClpP protease subunit
MAAMKQDQMSLEDLLNGNSNNNGTNVLGDGGAFTLVVKENAQDSSNVELDVEGLIGLAEKQGDTAKVEQLKKLKEFYPSFDIQLQQEPHTRYELHVTGPISPLDNSENFIKMVDKITEAKENDKFAIYINSPGGSINMTTKLVKTIKRHFKPENISTYIDNDAFSAGSTLFLIGHKRVISPESGIMFHDFSMGVWGKGQSIKDQIDFETERQHSIMYNEMVVPGYITDEEFVILINGTDIFLNYLDMVDRGIATHVEIGQKELTIEEFIAVANKTIEEEESKTKKKAADKKKKPAAKKTKTESKKTKTASKTKKDTKK